MTKEEAIKYLQQLYPNGGHCWLDEQRIEAIGMAVKALQGEPISSIWHDASEKSNEPEDIVIINPSDNTGEVLTKCTGVYQGRIWAYTSVLLKLDNPCKIGKNLQEEPVCNDLEEAADKHLVEKGYLLTTNNGEHLAEVEAKGLFKAGAQWQKEQTIYKACNYLFSHMGLFVTYFDDDIVEDIERSEFIKKFRIAMEET